jgi:hypothetical protein
VEIALFGLCFIDGLERREDLDFVLRRRDALTCDAVVGGMESDRDVDGRGIELERLG